MRTDGRTDVQIPPVFYRTSSPSGPQPKKRGIEEKESSRGKKERGMEENESRSRKERESRKQSRSRKEREREELMKIEQNKEGMKERGGARAKGGTN